MKHKSLIKVLGIFGIVILACTLISGIIKLIQKYEYQAEIRPTNSLYTESSTQQTSIPNLSDSPGDVSNFDPAPNSTAGIPGVLPSPSAGEPISSTIEILQKAIIPINNPIDLAERLENQSNLPSALEFPVKVYQRGDRESFWVTNTETNENISVPATLAYISEHVYFWVEDGVHYRDRDISTLVETFEEEIYPITRAFFGSEWIPGVDADQHLFILFVESLGGPVAGYFSSADEFLPMVRKYSNGHEMFLLSSEHIELSEEYALSVLAHEFQHMIHWYRDRNEETWFNEGGSSLASFLNGYSIGGHDQVFASNPDIQLNNWPAGNGNNAENYGASFLFLTYFLERFGEAATQSLISHPDNGLDSIDQVLASLDMRDPSTKQLLTADDFFLDWLITNYLQDNRVSDGRYSYSRYSAAPDFNYTHEIDRCPENFESLQVKQYGVNSLRIKCQGKYSIQFNGSENVPVLPSDPYSGSYAFYSNRGDESDMTLTREFDFSGQRTPLTLSYWVWYDLEEDFDYIYLEASTDGANWQILTTPSGTSEDPSGNSYGWGYNGKSGGGPYWIQESVDISQFSGEKVRFRFEYVTDTAVNGEGFWVDDISVPEIGYFEDFEKDNSEWNAEGFVRIQNLLAQTFQLALIKKGRETSVQTFSLNPENDVVIPVEIGGTTREAILIISGTSRFTRQKANYALSIFSQ